MDRAQIDTMGWEDRTKMRNARTGEVEHNYNAMERKGQEEEKGKKGDKERRQRNS